MEQSASSSATTSSSSLQGPRPAPLKVRKDSHKIRKPPPQQPVIIYTVSPKVVHADPSEFMSVVQRLTGAHATASATSSSVPAPPPAALPFPFPFFHVPSSSAAFPPAAPQPQLHCFPFQLQLQQQGPPRELIQLSPAARLAAIEQACSGAGDAGGLPPLPSILSPGSLPAVPPSFFSPPAGEAAGASQNLTLLQASASPPSSGAYYWDLFSSQPQYHQTL